MRDEALIKRFAGFLARLLSVFNQDQCAVRASGLAFATLLALVPLTALLFSLFSALGTFSGIVESLQTLIVRMLVPTQQEEIIKYVSQFVENTRPLGVVGLLFFLATSVLLLIAIQNTFDAVWGSRARTNPLRRFVTYASILIVGSFLASIIFNLVGMLNPFTEKLFPGNRVAVNDFLLGVLPPLLVFVALFLLIRFIPSGRVITASALLGAAVGAVLWEVSRIVFIIWITYVIKLSIIYGSLAVIPIFLIWLYLAWMIVLLSIEVTYVHQHRKHFWQGTPVAELQPAEILQCGFELFLFIARNFHQGAAAPTAEKLADELALTVRDIKFLTDRFAAGNLIITTGERKRRFVPSRGLDSISAEDVLVSLLGSLKRQDDFKLPSFPLYQQIVDAALESVRGKSIRDILAIEFQEADADTSPAADPIIPLHQKLLSRLTGRLRFRKTPK